MFKGQGYPHFTSFIILKNFNINEFNFYFSFKLETEAIFRLYLSTWSLTPSRRKMQFTTLFSKQIAVIL